MRVGWRMLASSLSLSLSLAVVTAPAASAAGTAEFLSPAPSSTITGAVAVAVATDEAAVEFRGSDSQGDEVVLARVPVSEGVATWTWQTWGWHNGPIFLMAAGCSTACGPVVLLHVVVSNTVPVLHKPAGTTFSGPMTFTADAPEGGVLFTLGKVRIYDATAPYSVTASTTSMGDGPRVGFVQRCATEAWCGTPSATVTWTDANLRPTITSWPPWISPNADGVLDSATLYYRLPDTETVSVSVTTESGELVRGPIDLGTKSAGSHTWTWRGKGNDGARASEGQRYVAVLSTRAGGLYGKATSAPLGLDVTAPRMTDVAGDDRVYPYPDDYRDAMTAAATVWDITSWPRTLTLTVRDDSGAVVRRTSRTLYGQGSIRARWYGRNGAGALVPAGSYTWRLAVTDNAGNTVYGPARTVVVSAKRAVERTFVLEVPASSGTVTTTDTCTTAPPSSYGVGGVDLRNDCDQYVEGYRSVEAAYRIVLPKAAAYAGLTAEVYGKTHAAGYFYGWVSPDGQTRLTTKHTALAEGAWHRFAQGTGLVGADGSVLLGLGVRSGLNPRDLDARSVRVTVYAIVLV